MKRNDIPYPCYNCFNMRVCNLHMNGNHDYACRKKPPSEYGNPECNKFETIFVEGCENSNDYMF